VTTLRTYFSLILVLTVVGNVFADEITCGPLIGAWVGPWDYNDPANRVPTGDAPQTRIKLVENVHFKAEHANLTKKDRYQMQSDIIYTLRAIPNHPRALLAVSKLEDQHKGKLPFQLNQHWETADCFFDRAIRFRPDDAMVRQVFGIHLHSHKRYKEAVEQFEKAKELGDATTQLEYNLGLAYFELREYDKAMEQAKIAYSQNFPLVGLKNMLVKAGKWKE